MKYSKIDLLVVIPVLALVLFGVNIRPPAAHATITSIITLTKTNCITLVGNVDWNDNGFIDSADGAVSLSVCNSLGDEGSFRALTKVLGGDPDDPKPSDFAKIDMDAGQVHDSDGVMYVVAFVANDDSVGFYASSGAFPISHKASAQCGNAVDPGIDFSEADCDKDATSVGDGVVVIRWEPSGAKRGPGTFTVRQDSDEMTADYKIVGEPDHISLKAIDAAIQTNAPVCVLFSNVPEFLAITTEPETSVLVATVTDSDGTSITGALVMYTVDDPDVASLAIPDPLRVALTPSLDLQALGLGSPEVICGGTKAGTVKITATLTKGSDALPSNLSLDTDTNAGRSDSITLPVQSQPVAMTLSAVPPNLVCDGSATSSVSANLTDDNNKAVANGNFVHFAVKALGSANPVDARSSSGAATTVLTPLSGAINGVLVHATWMRHVTKGATPTPVFTPLPSLQTPYPLTPTPVTTPEPIELEFVPSGLEQTMLVNCDQNPATVGELPGGAPAASVIAPPRTGSGGSQQSSWLVALPLGAVALLLVGSGLALRRRKA